MGVAPVSKKAALGRALLKVLRWVGVTLAREGVDLIVEKTTTKDDTLRISPAVGPAALDVRFRDQMITNPEAVRLEFERKRDELRARVGK